VNVLLVVLILAPSGALVRIPSPADLVSAVQSGDDVEIERLATRIGAVKLERQAEHGKPAERLAALHALPLVEDSWAVLPELARLISDGDSEVATRAAECARQVAGGMTPEVKEREEIPGDVPARAARELTAQAQKTSLSSTLRTTAIEALASLRGITRLDDKALAALLGDPDAQIRRAAAAALAAQPAGDKPLEEALVKDASADVAAAAGASLCRDVPLIPPTARPTPATMTPDTRAAKLSPAARTRLRALALDENVALADRLDLVACLRVAKKDADQQVLDQLARRPPETLRRRARALGGR
jgi:hypothetical protein